MTCHARLTTTVISLVIVGCLSPDSSELDHVAIRDAIVKAAAIPDPLTLKTGSKELELALREAMNESARVEEQLQWWPFTERSDLTAWSRVAHLAATRARKLRAERAVVEDEWKVAFSRASSAVEEASRVPVSPPGRDVARALRTASVELAFGEKLAKDGRFSEAIAAAARALDSSETTLRERDRQLARFDDPDNLRDWARWIDETLRDSRRRGDAAIIVDKLSRTLHVFESGTLVRSLEVDLGSGALARKLRQGDGATPEGRYHVREIREPGATRYHRALLLDYPAETDRQRFADAKKRGEIPARARIGGLVEIHGHGGQGRDWTEGCIALGDHGMDELVRYVRVGTPVTIVGRMP